ncbi:Nup35 RRM domain containing protein [Trichuris trichiura]|uniref:Nucleoporin NUP35 n=1 Tax=Trichuris trichiura TaxID=36087 RepID=A0A077Z448_TRITR|nr:Nup35 RRM domain containing protein [Trichuris trichiura]
MLEGVSSGLHGLSPVRCDLTSRSLSKGGDFSLTNTMECTTNSGYTTNGFPTVSQLDPFYTQGEDLNPQRDLDSVCVTVFGFDPETADMILRKFVEFGTICCYEISPSSNSTHILYQSRMQANLALGKNGKIFANRIKIDVEPCVDKVTRSAGAGGKKR